jgi:PAS domain S-box-containing protein
MGFDHKIIDAIPTLAWCAKPGGANEFLNRRWHNYTGLSVEEGLGWGWKTAIHPDDLGRLSEKWQALLAKGEPGESEARLRRSDGFYRCFLFQVEPLRDETGQVVQWYGRRPTSKIENEPSRFAPPRSGRWSDR